MKPKKMQSLLLLLYVICALQGLGLNAQTPTPTSTASSSSTSTTKRYVELQWQQCDLSTLAVISRMMASGVTKFFGASSAQMIDLRAIDEATLTFSSSTPANAQVRRTFRILYQVQMAGTATLPVQFDRALLVTAMNSEISTNLPSSSASLTIPLDSITSGTTMNDLPAAYAPIPALVPMPAPTTAFMRIQVQFRNLVSPQSLTQAQIYQVRHGLATFLSVPISQIQVAGPAATSASSVLLATQAFYYVFSTQDAATNERRAQLANLLLYGDASRHITEGNVQRPMVFMDAIPPLPVTTLHASIPLAIPYIFSSLNVERVPQGNPAVPPSPTPAAESVIPALSHADFFARVRKRHRFLFNPTEATTRYSSLPAATTPVSMSAASTCPAGSFCTYIYWKNSLVDKTSFWLESIQSVEQLSANFASNTLCTAMDTEPTLVGPVVGGTSTPVWRFSALSGVSLSRLEFALNLQSVEDNNATSLKVEIKTDVLSANEAATTVTSIAQQANPSSTPIFNTKSNVMVGYDALFRNTNEVFLFLELKKSTATTKDRSQPCAHCQNVAEFCKTQPNCLNLMNCVITSGIESTAANVPSTMFANGKIGAVEDVSTHFRSCLDKPDVDFRAMMLFSSYVRCQMQRACPFRTSGDRILLWDSVEGRQSFQTSATNAHFSQDNPVTIAVKVQSRTLCNVTVRASTTAAALVDRFQRRCKYSNYFGRVSATVSMTGSSSSAPNSFDLVELRYKYLAGPMPTLEVVEKPADVPTVQINSPPTLPLMRLRLENKDFNTVLPPAPTSPAESTCAMCRRLALDVCLRDRACQAFVDCVTRYQASSGGTGSDPSQTIGDSLTQLFRQSMVGASVSLTAAIDSCHSMNDVNQPAWRKLVNASACYSESQCPITVPVLFPNALGAAMWTLNPTTVSQTLQYTPPTGSTTNAPTNLRVPLQVVRDGQTITASGSIVANELQTQLRQLLGYSRLTVTEMPSSSGVQFSINYPHWIGKLPTFIPSPSAEWSLVNVATTPPPSTSVVMGVLNTAAGSTTTTVIGSTNPVVSSVVTATTALP